jgi:hypothetical protein
MGAHRFGEFARMMSQITRLRDRSPPVLWPEVGLPTQQV